MVTGFDVAWSTLAKAPTGGSYITCPKCGKRYQGGLGGCPFCGAQNEGSSDIAKGGGRYHRLRPPNPTYFGSTRGTKDFMASDRRALAPESLSGGGHLTGPPMSDQDWDFHEGYEGADQRSRAGPEDPDYDWEMAQQGDNRFDWPREQFGGRHPDMPPDMPYDEEDEEQVYGKYLAEQRQKERQGIMDEGIPDPRESGRGREPLPQGYEYGEEGRISRRPPPEIPTNPFRKAWNSLTR